MARRHKAIPIKKAALAVGMVFALPLLGKGFVMSIPYVSAMAEQAAFVSAGITLPEGTMSFFTQAKQDNDASQPTEQTEVQTGGQQENSSQPETSPSPDSVSTPQDVGITQEEIDTYSNHDGTIVRKQYTAGSTTQYLNIGGSAYIYNTTNVDNNTVIQAANSLPEFKIAADGSPQVLIMHTHTTESYDLAPRDFYDNRVPSRNRDTSRNMVRVGDEIAKQLEAAGIGVIHSSAEHDYPSYNGAYDRSRETVQTILKENPSIKIVLDIHRDAISTKDGTRYAPIANINGKNAAQVMIVSGCDDGTMNYPNYLKNLSFSSLLQKQMESDYPGLTRPVAFKYKFYNQDLTTGSILIEMGGHANSLNEAVYSGELVGKSLAKALLSIQE